MYILHVCMIGECIVTNREIFTFSQKKIAEIQLATPETTD